ncbi:MAG: hypothetical protein OHK93_007204 [Ramalina farinacea]|uniref:RRM domain-containing protein n=1 Tax=Ramalina farinacea TaxID=258253 RepID=A0AA43QK20_9LECA|nr:hypothetical protein [Ramalina farinacea]
MEVLVKGLPDQMTERNVEKEFRPILERFGIKVFQCQKLRSRGCALISFVDKNKGNAFLVAAHSGQRKFLGQPGVVLHGKYLRCSLSRNEPDPYLLKSLRKEESELYQKLNRKPRIVPGNRATLKAERTPRSFDISAIKCGQWTYTGRSLVFSSYWSRETAGRVVFGPRNLLIKLCLHPSDGYSHQLLIPFSTIYSFTIGPKDRSLTFSLYYPPRMQQSTEPSLQDALSKLGYSLEDQLEKMTLQQQGENFKRERLCALDDSHEKVVGSCLCYRFILQNPSDIRSVDPTSQISLHDGITDDVVL